MMDNFAFQALAWYGTGHAGCYDPKCAPEYKEAAIVWLLHNGMLRYEQKSDGSHANCNDFCSYTMTKKGQAWIDYIKTVPFPVETWVVRGVDETQD